MTDQPIIIVRPLESIEDFRAAEEVQRQVWPSAERDVVPLHMLTTVAHNGGLVLGAFHGERMVGFLLGIPDQVNRSNSQELRLRNWDLSPYVQDDIKLSPKLTFNVGLRLLLARQPRPSLSIGVDCCMSTLDNAPLNLLMSRPEVR